MKFSALVSLLLYALALPSLVSATPVRQELARESSRITFGVQSPNPTLTMNGSFQDFRGTFTLDPEKITDSALELTLQLSSLTLPPDQLMQALFVQGIISRVAPQPNTFRSTQIEHRSGNSYLLHGNYTWMNKLKKVSVPITIQEASARRTQVLLFLEGAFVGRNLPQQYEGLAASAKGTAGWTKGVLVFTPVDRVG